MKAPYKKEWPPTFRTSAKTIRVTLKSSQQVCMSWFRAWVPLFSAVFFLGKSLSAETDPDVLLRRALRVADFYNWIDAEPAFREAERLYGERGTIEMRCMRSSAASGQQWNKFRCLKSLLG